MTSVLPRLPDTETLVSSRQAEALARRLEQGALALAEFAGSLSDAEWEVRIPGDGRKVGVVVHHVASMYPVEIEVAEILAAGRPITDLTWDTVHAMNAEHARKHDGVTRRETLELLRHHSAAAAGAIRALSDEDLLRAAPVSMYADAPVTCQFMLEDHAVRHSYHHLAAIRRAVKR